MPSPASSSAVSISGRKGNLPRACNATRIRSAVVCRWPSARQIQSYASSGVVATLIRSSIVSSTRVQGGARDVLGARRIGPGGHGDMDGDARTGEQPVALSRGVMAEDGDWPGTE